MDGFLGAPDDFELPTLANLSQPHGLPGVLILWIIFHGSFGSLKALVPQRLTDGRYIVAIRRLHRLRPQANSKITCLHRIGSYTLAPISRAKPADEGVVFRPVKTLKVVPAGIVTKDFS